jgi:hypothetical protein
MRRKATRWNATGKSHPNVGLEQNRQAGFNENETHKNMTRIRLYFQ